MTEDDARVSVAQASRILSGLGVVDAFGHVSRRSPVRPDRFLLSRNMAPALVTPVDVIEHDLEGRPVSAPDARVFLERFIHAEIYRCRPDVGGVVHSHSPSVLPFTLVSEPRLAPVSHLCGFLANVARAFDVADEVGDGSDLLIRDPALGRAFAAHLGQSSVALMRAHGFTAAGETIAQAVFRAAYTASNAQIQQAALQLGRPRYLSAAEAIACERATSGQADRAWTLWVQLYGGCLHG